MIKKFNDYIKEDNDWRESYPTKWWREPITIKDIEDEIIENLKMDPDQLENSMDDIEMLADNIMFSFHNRLSYMKDNYEKQLANINKNIRYDLPMPDLKEN